MKEFMITVIIVGVLISAAFMANSLEVEDSVYIGCINYNANNTSIYKKEFCACAAKLTAKEASIMDKIFHKTGIHKIESPNSISKELGEKVVTFCKNM